MELKQLALKIASQYIGDFIPDNEHDDAAWLEALMKLGNPAHWIAGWAYCISAALSCFWQAAQQLNVSFPFIASPSTQQFYNDNPTLQTQMPSIGAIVIFEDGKTAQGHAEIIESIQPESGTPVILNTIGFNTSANGHASACARKVRVIAQLQNPDGFHIRGYIDCSLI
ncbi:MAG: hypothetical protein KGJ90_07335 [Patescibacteria group bacterium]|nr:hypothetical protein [Patescibacteria group bacterium]